MKYFRLIATVMAWAGLAANLPADQAVATNSTEAILQHPGFREGLIWIGKEPGERESARLLQIIGDLKQPYWRSEVEKFLEDYPDSPWAASLHYAYASFCHRTGRTTKALEHWEAAWNLVKDDTSAKGRQLGSAILANWTEQLSSLGRRDKLRELIPAGDRWPFASRQDREKFQSAKSNYNLMGRHPELSYRCGTLALKAVGQALDPTNQTLQSLVEIGSPVDGFSMAGLADFSKQYGLPLLAVRRTEGDDLIVPSVIHWRQNHYAAILKQDGENFLVNDPTFGKPHWMERQAINEEASGIFLIPSSKQTAHWQALGPVELASVHGKGLYNSIDDGLDKGCSTVTGNTQQCGCTSPAGMPVWWVSEPYNNVWIADEPLTYLTSTGEPFTFRLSYKQRDSRPSYVGQGGGVANIGWNMSWFSYVSVQSSSLYFGPTNSPSNSVAPQADYPAFPTSGATLYLGNGGEVDFSPGQTYDMETRLLLQSQPHQTAGSQSGQFTGENGLVVVHADGAQDIYGFGIDSYGVSGDYLFINYLLTEHIDPHGGQTTIQYTGVGAGQYVPLYIVDPDGRTNTLSYGQLTGTNVAGLFVLINIAGPYGQFVSLAYNLTNGDLTNIIDAQGIPSHLTYDTNGFPSTLVTPYGTNTFSLYENAAAASTNDTDGNFGTDSAPYVDRAELVTDPTGGKHLYLYQFDCATFMATNYPSGDVPTNTPLATLDAGTGSSNSISGVNFRNSFSWDARQYAALSTTNFLSFTNTDYLLGRMKHWLEDTNNLYLSEYLSVERDPSPDGTTEGLKTFYDYQGKTYNYQAGTNPVPSVTAWCLPGGETHYEYVRYDYFGNVTNLVTTYTTSSGTLGIRTNQYFYANNVYSNIFLFEYFDQNNNPDYEPIATNTFTVPNLLTQVIEANGSNAWTFGGFDVGMTTNYFPISNANGQTNGVVMAYKRVLPDYSSNALNQVFTRTYTNRDRVTSIQWPSGLTTTNIYYTNGFRAQRIDLQINRTNGYAYSTNGLPSTITNELGLVVNLYWDNLLRLTGASFPDTTAISNVYNRLDLSGHRDRLGNWTYFGHDGLRHLTSVTNANSNVTSYGWCDCGALTSITDALTNRTALNYDFQSRLTNVLFPDSSVRNYQYDLAGRGTNIADGSGNAVNLAFNNQSSVTNIGNPYGSIAHEISDILDRPASFTDANNVSVTNTFDMLDRVLTRVWTTDGIGEGFLYATNGLVAYTNRDSQITRFTRDAAGRLSAITNANVPPAVTRLVSDPADDLINLIDGLSHTNTWNYNQFGWVTNKVDASNNVAAAYSYNANGWLTNRWLPATGNTQYKFDAVGNLTNIVYSNSATAPISYVYDADNRLVTMIDAIGTTTWTYTSNNQVASETGPWTSNTVSYTYNQGHRATLTLLQPAGGAWTQNYSYDNAWRLTNLTSPAGAFNYAYSASASRLIQSLALPNAAYITNQYDSLARLTNTSLVNYWGHVLDGYRYAYDPQGLRTNISRYLGITTNNVIAGYDNIAQLTSWSAQEPGGALRLNEQIEYGFDSAGNLASRTNGALAQTFGVDWLNQLSTVTRTGTFTLSGATPAIMTNVTVNGQTAQTNSDFTFARTNISLTSGANTFTVVAQNAYGVAATNILTVNLPLTVTFQYDGNGNLTNDGTRNFIYDAENQLTYVYVTNVWQSQFAYDGLRRKRIEWDSTWSGSVWVTNNETRLIYDGMLPIQEQSSNNAVQVTYTRGLDLSGSRQGAGGIGGLLARTEANGSTFYHSDGSGNVTALIDATQNIVARYEYDPFGKLIGKWGALADANHYRFSSKEVHSLSGLYSYGFRFYEPGFQRWMNRDPIAESGGINQYNYVKNSPNNLVDALGLEGLGQDEYTLPPKGFVPPINNDPLTFQDVVDFGAGISDSLTFSLTRRIRNGYPDTFQVDPNSGSYFAGEVTSFAIGSARVAYASSAKCLRLIKGANALDRAKKISTARNSLKVFFRGGLYNEFRNYNWETIVAKYGGDAEEIISAATRTDPVLNATGAAAAGGAAYNANAYGPTE